MKLNPKKCVVMNFSFMRTKVISPKITIGNHELNEVGFFKLLGVMVQNDLKWNCHFNDIVKRASMRLHMLRILKGLIPQSHFVGSHLNRRIRTFRVRIIFRDNRV